MSSQVFFLDCLNQVIWIITVRILGICECRFHQFLFQYFLEEDREEIFEFEMEGLVYFEELLSHATQEFYELYEEHIFVVAEVFHFIYDRHFGQDEGDSDQLFIIDSLKSGSVKEANAIIHIEQVRMSICYSFGEFI